MASPCVRNNGAAGPRPHLPAFCRTRRPAVNVNPNSLAGLRLLVLLGLFFQLSTLLLVMAGAGPPRLMPLGTSTALPPEADVAASGSQRISPLADR